MENFKKGTWVEIQKNLLQPAERSKHLPEDSKKVVYEMRARGFLLADASLSETVEIKTLSDRIISGKLIEGNPGYKHGYGHPIEELLHIGEEEKKRLVQDM